MTRPVSCQREVRSPAVGHLCSARSDRLRSLGRVTGSPSCLVVAGTVHGCDGVIDDGPYAGPHLPGDRLVTAESSFSAPFPLAVTRRHASQPAACAPYPGSFLVCAFLDLGLQSPRVREITRRLPFSVRLAPLGTVRSGSVPVAAGGESSFLLWPGHAPSCVETTSS